MHDTLGDRLISAMKRARVKNDAIAKAAGVHVKTVSYWRSGSQRPGEAELDAITTLLRERGVSVTAAWLRYGDSPRGTQASDSAAHRLRLAELQLEFVRDYHATAAEVAAALVLMQCAEAQAFIATREQTTTPADLAAVDLMADAVRLELRRRRARAVHVNTGRQRSGRTVIEDEADEMTQPPLRSAPAIRKTAGGRRGRSGHER